MEDTKSGLVIKIEKVLRSIEKLPLEILISINAFIAQRMFEIISEEVNEEEDDESRSL